METKNELQNIGEKSKLYDSLKSMRIACRKYLDCMSILDKRFLVIAGYWGNANSWSFASFHSELRGTFSIMIAQMAAAYVLDVEDDFASIIPGKDE